MQASNLQPNKKNFQRVCVQAAPKDNMADQKWKWLKMEMSANVNVNPLTFLHCVFEMGDNGNVAGGGGRCRWEFICKEKCNKKFPFCIAMHPMCPRLARRFRIGMKNRKVLSKKV